MSALNMTAAVVVLFFSAGENFTSNFFEMIGFTEMAVTIILPIASIFVVLSSAFQYLRQYSSRAALHKQAGGEFSNLRRKMERYWSKGNFHPEAIHALNRTYNMISKSPPLVPDRIWERSRFTKASEILEINRHYYVDGEVSDGGDGKRLEAGGLEVSDEERRVVTLKYFARLGKDIFVAIAATVASVAIIYYVYSIS